MCSINKVIYLSSTNHSRYLSIQTRLQTEQGATGKRLGQSMSTSALFWPVPKHFTNCLPFGFNWNLFRRKPPVKMPITAPGIPMAPEIKKASFLSALSSQQVSMYFIVKIKQQSVNSKYTFSIILFLPNKQQHFMISLNYFLIRYCVYMLVNMFKISFNLVSASSHLLDCVF